MNSIARTMAIALLTFASGLAGFFVQWLLPVQYVSDGKGMVGSIVGLVTLLLALVLGLLVWTFNAISVAAEALGSIAVASAFFMILEFSQPYSGMFRISPVGVDGLISVIGR